MNHYSLTILGASAFTRVGASFQKNNVIMAQVELNKQAHLSEHLTTSSVATLGHSSELDGSRLSPHFTLAEMCKTSAKTPEGNIPSHVHIENLKRLCGWLEMLRKRYNERYVIPHLVISSTTPFVISSEVERSLHALRLVEMTMRVGRSP